MKTLKLFFVGMAALVCSNVMAQKLTAADVTVPQGATADLVISVESNEAASLAEFELKLPEGFTIDLDSYDAGAIWSRTHEVTLSKKKKSGNIYVLVMSKQADVFNPASGTLITLKLTADAELAVKDYVIDMLKINLTSDEAVQMNSEADEKGTINVTVTSATGINSLNAEDSNEPAFNLAGQQVSKNYKGIVVKNGKKAIVK
jgi:hypothetical protein